MKLGKNDVKGTTISGPESQALDQAGKGRKDRTGHLKAEGKEVSLTISVHTIIIESASAPKPNQAARE